MSKLLAAAAAAVANGVSTETLDAQSTVSYYWVDEEQILDNPFQYRQVYDPAKLLELAENIWNLKNDLPTLGLEQIPYARLVRLVDGDYVPLRREEVATHDQILYWLRQGDVRAELMFGHRRRRAWGLIRRGLVVGCKKFGIPLPEEFSTRLVDGDIDYAVMPMHIGYADNPQMWKHAVSENRHRSDVTAIEEAEAMAMAKNAFKYSDDQIGKVFGYARSTVANKQRLLKLPDGVRKMLMDGQLTERHGRELARLAEFPTEAIEAAKESLNDKLSPDMLERNVTYRLRNIEEKRKKRAEIAAAQESVKTFVLPGRSQPLGEVVVRSDKAHYEFETFDQTKSAETGLLSSGTCGKHCECFCLFHHPYPDKGALRPDPENAPNVLFGCASRQRRANQDTRWQKQFAATTAMSDSEHKSMEGRNRRKQIMDEANAVGQQLIEEAIAKMNLRALWTNVEFWRIIAKRNMPEQFSKRLDKCKSINDVADVYVRWLLDSAGRSYNSEAWDTVYDAGKLREQIHPLLKLAGAAVSMETDWKANDDKTIDAHQRDEEPVPVL